MANINTSASFKGPIPNKELLLEVISFINFFKPTKFSFRTDKYKIIRGKYDVVKIRELLMKNSVDRLQIETDEGGSGPYFSFSTNQGSGDQGFHWVAEYSPEHNTKELINKLALEPNFKVAYCVDSDDYHWQNEKLIANYERKGKSYDGLPTIPAPSPFNRFIDISKNPGRISSIGGVKLVSCWRMWFGPILLRYIDKDNILNFDDAKEISQIGPSIFVQLYESPSDASLPQSRTIQENFRRVAGFDQALEKKDLDIEDKSTLNISNGEFSHGGIVLVEEYLDDNNLPVAKSKATQVNICEYGKGGKLLYKEVKKIR